MSQTPSTEPHLPYLADEILLLIFSHFSHPLLRVKTIEGRLKYMYDSEYIDSKTLSSLCLVSKRFLEPARTLLYRAIPNHNIAKRLLLVRTLSQNVRIAQLVHSLHLQRRYLSDMELDDLRTTVSGHRRQNLPAHLLMRLKQAAADDGRDVEDMLMLVMCPNIRALQYMWETESSNSLVPLLDAQNQPPTSPQDAPSSSPTDHHNGANFPGHNLKELNLLNDNYISESTVHISVVGSALLSTLHTIRALKLSWEAAPTKAGIPKPRLPTMRGLQRLECVDSLCDTEGFVGLLSRCPNLKYLRFQWGHGFAQTIESPLDFGRMGDALRKYGTGLEVLLLDPRNEYFFGRRAESTGRIGSLRGLSRLTALTIPQDVLVGDELCESDDEGDDGDDEYFDYHGSRLAFEHRNVVPPLTLDEALPDALERLFLYYCQDDEGDVHEQIYSLMIGDRMKKLTRIKFTTHRRFSQNVGKLGWKVLHHRHILLTKARTTIS
ncbi:hypothetical protein BX600DRAFT_435535 [Xylariales sp. PMI_506]|nr:hypothetical protein BX600DRAFT_435535 [Xylariales sp. PMI_506]